MMVESVRSYSLISPITSDEHDTERSRSFASSATRRSCASFAYAWRSTTATDSTPAASKALSAAATSSSSSGRSTSPSAVTRPLTPRRFRRSVNVGGDSAARS
jgi:hypothetical protein